MAKTYTGNKTTALAIVTDPVAYAEKFIPLYDLQKTTEEQCEQGKADLKLAFGDDPKINGKMVLGDRQIMVESKTVGGGYAPVTPEAVKDVLRGADLNEVLVTTVNVNKLAELAQRYEDRKNMTKATQIRNLLTKTAESTQYSVAVRKIGVTTVPSSDPTAGARKGTATVTTADPTPVAV